MGIYLPNMEMPKEGEWISVNISPDGKCFIQSWCGKEFIFAEKLTAIPVPPHGRLIDADAAVANRNADMNWCYDLYDLPDYLSGCPTIIPAEEGEEET